MKHIHRIALNTIHDQKIWSISDLARKLCITRADNIIEKLERHGYIITRTLGGNRIPEITQKGRNKLNHQEQ